MLGMALSVRANSQEKAVAFLPGRPHRPAPQQRESGWSAAILTCLQLVGCGVLTVALGVLGIAFLAALF